MPRTGIKIDLKRLSTKADRTSPELVLFIFEAHITRPLDEHAAALARMVTRVLLADVALVGGEAALVLVGYELEMAIELGKVDGLAVRRVEVLSVLAECDRGGGHFAVIRVETVEAGGEKAHRGRTTSLYRLGSGVVVEDTVE